MCWAIIATTTHDAYCKIYDNRLDIFSNVPLIGNISFLIENALNPPSLQPVYLINATINTVNGTLEYYNNASISSTSACEVYPQITLTNEKINSHSNYTFSFYTCNPVNENTQILVKVPVEIKVFVNTV